MSVRSYTISFIEIILLLFILAVDFCLSWGCGFFFFLNVTQNHLFEMK